MSAANHPQFSENYPFLGFQKNSFLRKIKNKDYIAPAPNAPFLYQKPQSISQNVSQALPLFWTDKLAFSQEWRVQIENYISSYGLKMSMARDKDTPAIKEFLNRRYPRHIADEICAFDLYRFRKFGHGVILADDEGKIQGTIFEVGYDTPEKTSYTLRLAISEELKGKNLGYHIMMYSSLLAMEQGSRVKRGLLEFTNLRSMHINLNKVGWICDGIEPNITELGSFFHIMLPLDPRGLTSNVVDFDKLKDFILTHREGMDFRLMDTHDFEGVCNMYEKTDFKISALMLPGMVSEKAKFFALPSRLLQLSE